MSVCHDTMEDVLHYTISLLSKPALLDASFLVAQGGDVDEIHPLLWRLDTIGLTHHLFIGN